MMLDETLQRRGLDDNIPYEDQTAHFTSSCLSMGEWADYRDLDRSCNGPVGKLTC